MSPSLQGVASIADLRRKAQRRLPRMAFDYLDGGEEAAAAIEILRSGLERTFRLLGCSSIEELTDEHYSLPVDWPAGWPGRREAAP